MLVFSVWYKEKSQEKQEARNATLLLDVLYTQRVIKDSSLGQIIQFSYSLYYIDPDVRLKPKVL